MSLIRRFSADRPSFGSGDRLSAPLRALLRPSSIGHEAAPNTAIFSVLTVPRLQVLSTSLIQCRRSMDWDQTHYSPTAAGTWSPDRRAGRQQPNSTPTRNKCNRRLLPQPRSKRSTLNTSANTTTISNNNTYPIVLRRTRSVRFRDQGLRTIVSDEQ